MRKKFIVIPVLVALVVVTGIAGIAFAQDEGETAGNTLLARVAAILGIEQAKVEEAFAQAQQEMRAEALDTYLNDMVEQGKITAEEAEQYRSWWDAKPEALNKLGPAFGFGGRGGGFRQGGGGMWMERQMRCIQPAGTTQ